MFRLEDWKWAFVDLLIPPACIGCDVVGIHWCLNCQKETQLLTDNLCSKCGKPDQGDICEACLAREPYYSAARSFAQYVNPFKKLVIALKYRGNPNLGHFISDLIASRAPFRGWTPDLGVAVPLSAGRLAARGYNQVELYARPLCQRVGIPYSGSALTRNRETVSQVGLTGNQRRHNLRGAFAAEARQVSGRSVILFDDVYTTGSTVNECSKALRAAGAAEVVVFTLARALGKPEELWELA
jgi:ComF family protein